MPNSAGYSGTPLWKKLGIKEGAKCLFINEPDYFFDLIADAPVFTISPEGEADLIVLFTNELSELQRKLKHFNDNMKRDAALWISWYKKASKKPTEIKEDEVRNMALTLDLVDVKVCAVDQDWSGLKLMIRKDRR